MKTCTSISGGRTSAYLAVNYPSDYNVFSLVRVSDPELRYPDETLRRRVEDRIQAPFIGTVEDDKIIHTIFDLEQFLGKEISWVTGITYEEVINKKGGRLPNKKQRYCTTFLKIEPIFYWCRNVIGEPVEMRIGYRSSEHERNRADRMIAKCNKDGLLEYRTPVGKLKDGRNKWGKVPFQKPSFPLIYDGITEDDIKVFWRDKPVRFADYNNCVGCFHREPVFLAYQYRVHPKKMAWFEAQEKKGTWRADMRYERIKTLSQKHILSPEDFSGCDMGYCEL